MLDLRWVVEHIDEARAALARRGAAAAATLDGIADAAAERRAAIAELEAIQQQRNAASATMAKLDKKSAEFVATRDAMKKVGEQIKALEAKVAEVEARCEQILLYAPNVPHESTPDG